jgi:hypothetical protein
MRKKTFFFPFVFKLLYGGASRKKIKKNGCRLLRSI